MPHRMWLTYLGVDEQVSKLRYDLAVDASGRGRPWHLDAGLPLPRPVKVAPPAATTSLPTTTLSTLDRTVALPVTRAMHERGVAVLWPALLGSFTLAAAIATLATRRRRRPMS